MPPLPTLHKFDLEQPRFYRDRQSTLNSDDIECKEIFEEYSQTMRTRGNTDESAYASEVTNYVDTNQTAYIPQETNFSTQY